MAGRFRLRPTRHTGVVDHGAWRVKWYEITLDGHPVDPRIVQAAHRLAADVCARDGDGVAAAVPTGVGFGIIHHGAESVWVLLDRWHGDIISQHTWSAELIDPGHFTPVPPGGPTACVWELAVHGHERAAFIEHVLDPIDGPDLDAYLADVPGGPGRDRHRGRTEVVEAFARAWAAGDVGALMALMSDDPVYRPSVVPEPGFGTAAETRCGTALLQ